MLNEMWDAYGNNLTIAVVGVAAGFLCLILVLWLIRGRGGPSPFLRGGKNRQPRLQVLDAAAVDARRRLVLVRRDDVEHLIMIGGPTDVVIESSIVDGRSPPYHTMMKTVSEPEQTAIGAEDAPRVAQHATRQQAVSTPPVRVSSPVEKAEKAEKSDTTGQRAQADEKNDFVWLGSDPVELSPAEKPAEAVRAAVTPHPAARSPETPRPAEAFATPAQSVPVTPPTVLATPKAADIAQPVETRPAAPAPVIDFPTAEPRAPSALPASPALVMPAFPPSGAAVAVAQVAARAEPAPMVRIDDTSSDIRAETPHEMPREVTGKAEPDLEIVPSRAENDAPSLDQAANLLDAARDRVFQQPRSEVAAQATTAPVTVAAPGQRPSPTVVQIPVAPTSAPAKPLGSDFERILEEEMASNLAGSNTVPPIGPATGSHPVNVPASQMPRRDPGLPRVTGATQEPALQNEIARIFGEMSVTKDDR